jgi:hypothetical protein
MRKLITILFCLISLGIVGQPPKGEFDGHKWQAPYKLDIPEGWGVERFLIPISFAPEIAYTGVEDIRFTPGWGKAQSDQYWTYAFLWYLDGAVRIKAKDFAKYLKAYYTGLIGSNIEQRKIPNDKLIPVWTSVKKTKRYAGDLRTYSGKIEMLDYMSQKPITLNCTIHVKACTGESKSYIFYEISPKPRTDNVWVSLDRLWADFQCKQKQE